MPAIRDRSLALKALAMAVDNRHSASGLNQHSDRGRQYASKDDGQDVA